MMSCNGIQRVGGQMNRVCDIQVAETFKVELDNCIDHGHLVQQRKSK